eukprot:1192647-Prorocentrum_minimum.AAC.5
MATSAVAEATPTTYGAVGLSEQDGDGAVSHSEVSVNQKRQSSDGDDDSSLMAPVAQDTGIPPDVWREERPAPSGWVARTWVYWGYLTAYNCFNSL